MNKIYSPKNKGISLVKRIRVESPSWCYLLLVLSALVDENVKNLNFLQSPSAPLPHTFSFLRRSLSTSSISSRQPSCMVWKLSCGARVNSDCRIRSSCSRITGNRGRSRGFERQHATDNIQNIEIFMIQYYMIQ